MDTEKISSAASTLREATERFGQDIRRGEPGHAMHEAREAAGEIYEQAGGWLQDNYGKALAAVGALTIAGVVGYMIGRNSLSTSSEVIHPEHR